jgi:hypothetical protein
MTLKKTRKLKCIITGKTLTATADYYSRKVEKAGDEDTLHRTYVCKEAKNLMLKGYGVDKIRDILEIDASDLDNVTQETMDEILEKADRVTYKRVNTFNNITNMINTRTDPKVLKLIENIKNGTR